MPGGREAQVQGTHSNPPNPLNHPIVRKELELIEKIEAYLQGHLAPGEAKQFEEQVAADPSLQEAVSQQRLLMTGIQRAGIRDEVRKAKRRYYYRLYMIRGAIFGLCVLLLAFILFYQGSAGSSGGNPPGTHQSSMNPSKPAQQASTTDTTIPGPLDTAVLHAAASVVPSTDTTSLQPLAGAIMEEKGLLQTFLIDPLHDTVVETHKGIVLSILSHTFLDASGHAVTSPIRLFLKEALDPATIMMQGLSTRSGDQPLTTGGMFFLDARLGSQSLKIDTTRPIITQIPAEPGHGNMQLYKGQRMPNGNIDWVDPRPLDHRLVPVDPTHLNFYPPHYLDSLSQWGYDSRHKRYTDSLYYALSAYYNIGANGEPGSMADRRMIDTVAYHPRACGLDPAKVKTIWSSTFRNTLIATREFEQRLQVIHACRDANALLDLYMAHLNWNLSDIDSLAATRTTGEERQAFELFAAQHDGKVNGSPQFQELAAYYRLKSDIYRQAIQKTEKEYWSRQAQMDSIAADAAARHDQRVDKRADLNLQNELFINLKNACGQIGYPFDSTQFNALRRMVPPILNPPQRNIYTAAVTTTGWCNVDMATVNATYARRTLNYADQHTGKLAVIRYMPVSITIVDAGTYDKLNVYLLPDKLSSFMLLKKESGNYTEMLNELLQYDLVCVGYKEGKAWYYQQRGVRPGAITNIRLVGISKEEVIQRLNEAGSLTQAAGLQEDNEFFNFDIVDKVRKRRNYKLEVLRIELLKAFFPCYMAPETKPAQQNGVREGQVR